MAWRANAKPRPNLLIVTLDTTRADRLGAWNGPADLTPVLDELASESVVFERAYAPVPLTLPSHASLMTGLYPPEHGLRVNSGLNRLSDEVPVLAEMLRRRGYRTGAFVGAFVLDHKFGLDRGFDVYDDRMEEAHGPTPGDPHGHKMRSGSRVVDAALSWLNGSSRKPFFCWVHLFDAHTPYDARQDRFGDRFLDQPYDAGIAYVDRQVGRLLAHLRERGLAENTLVIVVGDHGESLGEHQEHTHGFFLYESTLHVPLILRQPGPQRHTRKIPTPVSLVDLFPTILAMLDPQAKIASSGRSLLPACEGEELPLAPLYAESNHPTEECGAAALRGLVTDRWKYIRSPRRELYDLQADPGELRNLIDDQSEVAEDLERKLQDREAALVLRDAPSVVVSPHEKRLLASLGYAGGGAGGNTETERPDIKDLILYYNLYCDAQELLSRGDYPAAAAKFAEVVEGAPNYFQAWYNLGVCRGNLGDLAGAEAAYRRAVEIDANATALTALGSACLALEQPAKALPPLESAVELQPDLLRALFFLGEAHRRLQHAEAARKAYLDALSIDPEFLPAREAIETLRDD